MTTGLTPSQTVGPFFHFGLPWRNGEPVAPHGDPDAIHLRGAVYDGAGEPVPDAMVEIWQANSAGRYAHPEDRRDDLPLEPGFTGFGRCFTDGDGSFEFLTVKPGPVPASDGSDQAPHIEVAVFARGLLRQVFTRIYFPDEREANGADPVLSSIEDENRRSTLVARAEEGAVRFDVHLQGDRETVFFDL